MNPTEQARSATSLLNSHDYYFGSSNQMRTFSTFLMDSVMPNEWVLARHGSTLALYVRRTPTQLRDSRGDIQIANMLNTKPGEGELKRFLDKWDAPPFPIRFYFENVINPKLEAFLLKRGYKISLQTFNDIFHCLMKEKLPQE